MNDIFKISRCVFMYLASYLSEKLCLKTEKNNNREVLKSKLLSTEITIFTSEYLQNDK